MAESRHTWKFFRAGGVDQVVLATAADLAHLHALDQKLWVALACPVQGLEFDARTLTLLDADADGRIRPPDILASIAWLQEILVDLGDVFEPTDEIPLTSISEATPAGKSVKAGARLILENLGKSSSKTISLADVSDTEKIFVATKLNGDGIVLPESADDAETSQAIAEVASVMGTVTDRSGKPGVDQARVDAFFDQARNYAEWHASGQSDAVRVLGDATRHAFDALSAVRAKVDDYFSRVRLASYDTRAADALNPSEPDLASLSPLLLTAQSEEVARLPVAKVEAGRALPLVEGLNPAWAPRIADFAGATVAPMMGGPRSTLTAADWEGLAAKLEPYRAWRDARPSSDIVKLGEERVLALARGEARERITELIAKDAGLAPESDHIESVEKLIRFRRDLVALLQNFVNFAAFYGRRESIFQTGTLYLDARSCDLCLPVHDAGRHALLASRSQVYLAYCDCVRRRDKEKRSIVAAVTGGGTDNLMVGRNGVFYDRKGEDWDATITSLVENPISVAQAFWSPYKRFIRLVEEQFAKRAKNADEESNKNLQVAAVGAAGPADKKAEAAPAAVTVGEPTPPPKGIDVGTVAAIGVAIGGIATFFSSILATFLGLGMWMPLGLTAALLAISGPSMLVAYLKLRQRNIGPILDANGWAVNAMARINVPFGDALTAVATLPPGASRTLRDPFADKKRHWGFYGFAALIVVLAGAWFFGRLDTYLPDKGKASTVLHRAPAPQPSSSPAPPR
jgi:hypothetical protein